MENARDGDRVQESGMDGAMPLLPRQVRIGLGILVVGAVALGIMLFDRTGGGVTNPGGALPRVGERFALLASGANGTPVLTNADGSPFDMASLAGHPLWINFWASWCPPCREEMPDLQGIYRQEQVQHPDLILLLVDTNDVRATGAAFYQKLRLAMLLAFNDGSRDVGPYRILNLPTHIMVDKGGIVRKVIQGNLPPDTAREALRSIE